MGHAEAMKVIVFSKYSKLYLDFENAIKFGENVDSFEDFHAGLSSFFSTLPRASPNSVLKPEFSGIEVTTFFVRYNLRHIEDMKMIFFSKSSKFYVHFRKVIKFSENVDVFEDKCF